MPSAPQGLEQLAGMLSAWRIIPPWRLAVSVCPRASGNGDGCRQYRRCQRHYQAADWRLATAQLLEIAGVGENDRDFMRYSRQILLDDIALAGSKNCSTARC